jgi:serine/threonine protein phosphatase 1
MKMNDRYYVFPDIHGCMKLFEKAFSFVEKENSSGGKIIFLGDYIDRGPDSKSVVEFIRNPPSNWNFISLKGNHEQVFVENFKKKRLDNFYDKNVLLQWTKQNKFMLAYKEFPLDVLDWMDSLSLYHLEDDLNIFCHAYIKPNSTLSDQDENMSLWIRYNDFEDFEHEKWFLTHGHTPKRNAPILLKNRCNLDAGIFYYGKFVIAEFHRNKKGPIQFYSFR